MNYAVYMGSDATIYVPSLIMSCLGVQNLIGEIPRA
jgi:hypothetical protein